jgi:cytochrome oxidase Cu insertion factor (SCO1/SenC/PrrC family)
VAEAAQTFGVPWQSSSASRVADHGVLFYLVAPDGHMVQVLHPQQPVGDLVAAIEKRVSAAREP